MKIIDIHCHVLPDIDDGASSKEETLEMLHLMKRNNIVGIIATPHYRIGMFTPNEQKVRSRFEWSKKIAYHFEIEMYLGSECYIQSEIFEQLDERKYMTLNNSEYILVEFSRFYSYNIIRQYLIKLISKGYRPIVAHVERVEALCKDLSRIKEIVELGVELQVNAEAVMGKSGFATKRKVWNLIHLDLVTYIASDCHDSKKRIPNLRSCYKYVLKKKGVDYANEIFYKNPSNIIL